LLAVALLTVAGSIGAAHATTFDAFTEFQTVSNTPVNRWSYWSTGSQDLDNYNGTTTLMPTPFPGTCGFGTSCWFTPSPADRGAVLQNNTGGAVAFQTEIVPDGTLALYPRVSIALVRFLAPEAGAYTLQGSFQALSSPQDPTRWAVVVNGNLGAALLDSPGHSLFGEVLPFSFSLTLNANDTVDFLAFRPARFGTANNRGATGLDVHIASAEVPEPSTLFLLASGLAVGSGLAWRRRHHKL
jgi:hypothetical protein